jgi:hypothetical protein
MMSRMSEPTIKMFLVMAVLPEVPDSWAGEDAVGFIPEEAEKQFPAVAAVCIADDAQNAVDMIGEFATEELGVGPINCVVRDIGPYAAEIVERELEGQADPGTLMDVGLRMVVGDDEGSQSEALQFAFDALMNEDIFGDEGEEDDEDFDDEDEPGRPA